MPLFEILVTHASHICVEKSYHHISRKMKESDFLHYDPRYLIDCYGDEDRRLGRDLPYIEEASFLRGTWRDFVDTVSRIRVSKLENNFELENKPPKELSGLQVHAWDKFSEEGRLDRVDEAVTRLEGYDAASQTLSVQRCVYSDGLKSNYAMDLMGHMKFGSSSLSLRALFQSQYGRKLPSLTDRRLSNAIGLAVVIFYRTENRDVVPYLPRRSRPTIYSEVIGTTRKQAVFSHGGYHCTASGEASWRTGFSTFDELFTEDICRELYQEVGVKRQDLEWIYPVSLCREFLRGGKPQIFFAGYTKLSPKELNDRRTVSIQNQQRRGRQEILNEILVAETPEQLYSQLWTDGTTEALANMMLAHNCAILANDAKMFR